MSLTIVLLAALAPLLQAEDIDLLVYGATPAGIAAALAAGRDGARVLLVEPRARIGGMLTNGLSHADFRTFESLSGLYLDFSHRVEAFYEKQYGRESPQFKECLRGTNAEPKVNLAVLEEMLAEVPSVKVQRSWELENLRCSGSASTNGTNARSLEMALFLDAEHQRHTIAAHYFVDATYEGDLMAAAEIPYKVGREGRVESGEPAAPPTADDQIQAYNFRMIMT
ncbi:MAG: FAD-dependent oxidoreductase, partial [Verrucomicrobiota bacterium]